MINGSLISNQSKTFWFVDLLMNKSGYKSSSKVVFSNNLYKKKCHDTCTYTVVNLVISEQRIIYLFETQDIWFLEFNLGFESNKNCIRALLSASIRLQPGSFLTPLSSINFLTFSTPSHSPREAYMLDRRT